jgi:hypothetical protein
LGNILTFNRGKIGGYGDHRLYRYFNLISIVLAPLFLLAACASPVATEISTLEPSFPIQGASVDVVPLDPSKANSPEFMVLRSIALVELGKKGMKPVDSGKVAPSYLVLMNYAVDLGDDISYERRLAIIVYEFKSGKKVQHVNLSWFGRDRISGEVFGKAIAQTVSRLPISTGIKKTTITE